MSSFPFNQEEIDNLEFLINTAHKTKSTVWYENTVVKKLIEHKEKYQAVAEEIGCPTTFVMGIHIRENARDIGRFSSYLGNGQALDKVTTFVPKGRGPFSSWEEGAIDALKLHNLDEIEDWSMERMVYEWERFNGFGYRWRQKKYPDILMHTPYVWNHTQHYEKGRFVSDGKFNPRSEDKNIGCFVLHHILIELDPSLNDKKEEPSENPVKKVLLLIVDFIMGLIKGEKA